MTGVVFNIQRFSVHDGPGIRTTVFLKGCPLRCLWCHNPEGLSRETDIEYIPVKCIGCGRCYISCYDAAHQAIDWNEKKRRPELNANCVGCHLCLNVCPVQGCITPGEIKWKVRDKDGNAVREAKDPTHIKFKKDARKDKKLALKEMYD